MICYDEHLTNNCDEFAYNISSYECEVNVICKLLGACLSKALLVY